jgi:hypothetical protein
MTPHESLGGNPIASLHSLKLSLLTPMESPSALSALYSLVERPVPSALSTWEEEEGAWCRAYRASWSPSELREISDRMSVFIYDLMRDRVMIAYAVSRDQGAERDSSRMQGFPVEPIPTGSDGEPVFVADRGHFIAHASGGRLDINLFPQRRELNRGWSAEGKAFRSMERYVAERPGTFCYHRAIYDDESPIPDSLEFGVLVDDRTWRREGFRNK